MPNTAELFDKTKRGPRTANLKETFFSQGGGVAKKGLIDHERKRGNLFSRGAFIGIFVPAERVKTPPKKETNLVNL